MIVKVNCEIITKNRNDTCWVEDAWREHNLPEEAIHCRVGEGVVEVDGRVEAENFNAFLAAIEDDRLVRCVSGEVTELIKDDDLDQADWEEGKTFRLL